MANDSGRSLTKGERRLLVAVGLFIGIVLGTLYWWQQNNVLPVIAIPTPVMPNPNAYDLLMLTYQQVNKTIIMHRPAGLQVKGAATQHAAHRTSTLASGASPKIAGATSTTLSLNDLADYLAQKDDGRPNITLTCEPTPAEIHALLRANAQGFATLHRALQYEYGDPMVRGINLADMHLAMFRNLARDLLIAGRVKSDAGDWTGALENSLDAVQLGEKMSHGALINLLVGIDIQNIGREKAWKIMPHLNAAQARLTAQRLETITHTQASLAEVVQEGKWCRISILLEIFRHPQWWDEWQKLHGHEPTRDMSLRLQLVNKREVIAHCIVYQDALIANAKLPYAASKTPLPIFTDPVNAHSSNFDRIIFRVTLSSTQNALLEVTLALQAYYLDHGGYPAKLSALTPHYLKTIPDDPFALKGPLRYRLKGSQYVLYSIGPDGKDDGGVPSQDGLASLKALNNGKVARNYSLKEQSKGDIVAGVNIR